jgi:hypothetical protein
MALSKCAPWIGTGEEHEVSASEAEAVKRLFNSLSTAEAEAEAKEKDRGWLPLHTVAVYAKGRYSIAVFVPIFNAYPSAAKEKTPDGSLPLHFVAQHMGGAEGPQAMQLLLKEYPQAAKEKTPGGYLPLHYVAQYMGGTEGLQAMQLLLKEYPQAAREKTFKSTLSIQENLPIRLTCLNENGATLEMVHELLSAYPQGVMERDSNGHAPYAVAAYHKRLPADAIDFLRRAEQGESASASISDSHSSHIKSRHAYSVVSLFPFHSFSAETVLPCSLLFSIGGLSRAPAPAVNLKLETAPPAFMIALVFSSQVPARAITAHCAPVTAHCVPVTARHTHTHTRAMRSHYTTLRALAHRHTCSRLNTHREGIKRDKVTSHCHAPHSQQR